MRSFSIIEKLDIANFVDDNTSYVTGDNISPVVKLLEEVGCAIFQWLKDNEMKANTDKCFLALIVNNISRSKYIFGKYYFQLYIWTYFPNSIFKVFACLPTFQWGLGKRANSEGCFFLTLNKLRCCDYSTRLQNSSRCSTSQTGFLWLSIDSER